MGASDHIIKGKEKKKATHTKPQMYQKWWSVNLSICRDPITNSSREYNQKRSNCHVRVGSTHHVNLYTIIAIPFLSMIPKKKSRYMFLDRQIGVQKPSFFYWSPSSPRKGRRRISAAAFSFWMQKQLVCQRWYLDCDVICAFNSQNQLSVRIHWENRFKIQFPGVTRKGEDEEFSHIIIFSPFCVLVITELVIWFFITRHKAFGQVSYQREGCCKRRGHPT